MTTVNAQELANLTSQHPSARTVLLVMGALVCLTVAALPFLNNRANRANRDHAIQEQVLAGTDVPYAPPERPPTDGKRLSIAALISAAAFVAAIWLPGTTPNPVQPPVALPSATAIAPGTGIAVTYADGTGGMSCTAGFLVRTNTGQTGVLTAGHCNKPGEASRVSINDGSGTYVDIGTFGQDVSEGNRGEAHDIGLIMLDSDKVPRTSAITATVPVVGIATDLRLGQVLCKFGMKTGKALCGQITEITESKVAFLAGGECGDSGGPVYLVQSDGTAVAVGIHIRGGRPNDPNPNCSVPATFSVAELLQPWLDKWGLTAVTETGSH